MRKVLTVLPIVLALMASFYWVRKKAPIDTQVHEQIQNQFRQKIKKYILNSKSSRSKNLKIDKVWTKALSEKTIKVDFEYSFEGQKSQGKKYLKGFALLRKELTSNEQIWILNQFHILEQSITLKDALRIKLESPEISSEP